MKRSKLISPSLILGECSTKRVVIKIPDESVGPADEEVSPQEACEEGGDVEDPLEEVQLQMDPAQGPPSNFQLPLLPLSSSLFLVFVLLK